MAIIKYEFKLTGHAGFPPPAVVAGYDIDNNRDINATETLNLTKNGATWRGERDVPDKAIAGLVVMSVFSAKARSIFEITITHEGGKTLAHVRSLVHQFPQAQFLMLVAP
jgi:hypothetical protein